ncbi:YesL family protein [Planomicrobium okeanokoites]|uniref:YesL family protein n=1 Tax=Planomicrobium okeanokoites TaxID=244 RepID=UPI002490AA93|nr:DUF624 domain-containing protein [Planomicrobium okeanokoites]
MVEFKGLAGVFYGMSEWVMRFSGVNLLWFLLSLPFFILFVTVEMSSATGLVFFGLAGWLFASFLFFPATAAVFSITRDWIVEEDYSSIMKKYFTHLKADYRENAKMGAIFAAVWLVWYYAYFYLYTEQSSAALMFLVIGIALYIYTVNFLLISSHYRMNAAAKMKNAFFLSAGRPLTGLFIAAVSAVLIWLSTTQLQLLFPLLTCSLTAFLSFSAFYRTTQKITEKAVSDDAG